MFRQRCHRTHTQAQARKITYHSNRSRSTMELFRLAAFLPADRVAEAAACHKLCRVPWLRWRPEGSLFSGVGSPWAEACPFVSDCPRSRGESIDSASRICDGDVPYGRASCQSEKPSMLGQLADLPPGLMLLCRGRANRFLYVFLRLRAGLPAPDIRSELDETI